MLEEFGLLKVGVPSKALFAGDHTAYRSALDRYIEERRFDALGGAYFDEFWTSINRAAYTRLLNAIRSRAATPFVGAGASLGAGYPMWGDHLTFQARLGGVTDAKERIARGEYEDVVDEIFAKQSAVFTASIRTEFLKAPTSLDFHLAVLRLFKNVVVTTNYDRCLELAYEQLEKKFDQLYAKEPDNQALIAATTNQRSTLLKLHGDIDSPESCILTRSHYEAAYGKNGVDFSLPIPRKLRRLYETTSFVFIGCSLSRDRTLDVFEKVMLERGASDLPSHFAIVSAPVDERDRVERNAYLLKLGVTPIFYPPGEHRRVLEIIEALSLEIEAWPN